MPIPSPELHSVDQDWFLKPKHRIVDLNPYFGNEDAGIALIAEQGDDASFKSNTPKTGKRSACETFYKDFVDICDKSDHNNAQVMSVIKSKMVEMKIEVLKLSSKNSPQVSTSSLASFPNIEKHHNRKRLAPPSSPSSAKRRKQQFLDITAVVTMMIMTKITTMINADYEPIV